MAAKPGRSEMDRQIVQTLLDTKAVDFEAIGAAVAKFGPTVALEGDGDDNFCWTMRYFVRLFVLPGPLTRMDDLGALRGEVAPELRRGGG